MSGTPKSILVTDADRGVGRETALLLAERGARVLAQGEDAASMADLPRETNRGGLIEITHQPLEDRRGCEAALDRVAELFGRFDGLVSTGGLASFGPVEEASEDRIRALLEANFLAPLRLIQAAAPRLRARRQGTVICVSTAAGRIGLPLSGAYSASRYALEGLCDALRLELGIFGVDVVLVEPGLIRDRVAPDGVRGVSASSLFGVGPQSPYADIATVMTETYHQLIQRAATPHDVAVVIDRALSASRPKARYAVSRATAAMLLARKVLPDRLLDTRLVKAMGIDFEE
ncbi:MAG: SDR family NAD(P)-dependent oxidoreductase [Deltaproteobacteria bacterium]|nr:SDR family NAD(P)-dependent oxidoreductase [Deltaproteobacteria bacterium]MCB9788227.1 SDR family NAD(P)-dependent oxidoreductase [Deltaproteobacteria bacterium]